MPLTLRSRPFSQTLFVFIVALIVLIVVGITVVDYTIAERNLREHQRLLEEQTEIDLTNSIILVDAGLKLFDDTLNGQMSSGLEQFIAEYELAGRNASAMDLARIKHDVFHDTMDLYMINASNMVEFTTYPPDQDLDFGEFELDEYLNGIRNASGFYPDRVIRETETGVLRKYAYAPTSDHRYVLELGLIGEAFRDERHRLQYTATIEDIKELNPYVQDVRIFTLFKRQVGNSSFRPDAMLSERLDRVIANRSGFEWICPKTAKKIRYAYIDLRDNDYASDISMVTELSYSTQPLEAALAQTVAFHGLAALAALVIGLVTASFVSRRLTDPIRSLVGDVNAIAKGDLDHPIESSPSHEFTVLGTSIATMVGQLKGTIEQLRQHEANLSESEDRYRRTLDLVSDYAYCRMLDPDGHWTTVWWSGTPERVCLYSFDQLEKIGGWEAIVHADDRAVLQRHLDAVLVNELHESEFRVIARDGEVRWVSHRTMPIMDPLTGRVTGYYAAGQDVTETGSGTRRRSGRARRSTGSWWRMPARSSSGSGRTARSGT